MEVSITIAAVDEISEAWGHPSISLVTTTDGSAVCAAASVFWAVYSAADTGNCENMVTAPSPRASRAAVILFFFIIMVDNTPVHKNVEK